MLLNKDWLWYGFTFLLFWFLFHSLLLLRFENDLQTTRKEFVEKHQQELEKFMESVESAWHVFLEQQKNQKNSFRSELEMQKSVFLTMQKENQDEFFANEEMILSKFKEKQVEERVTLQERGSDFHQVYSFFLLLLPPASPGGFHHHPPSDPVCLLRPRHQLLPNRRQEWSDRARDGWRQLRTSVRVCERICWRSC